MRSGDIKQLVIRLSAALMELDASIQVIREIQPANEAAEREKFMAAIRQGQEYNPRFEYASLAFDLKRTMTKLNLLGLDALLGEYGTPIEPLISCARSINCALRLLEARGTSNFSSRAVEWHGLPTHELLVQANQLLINLPYKDPGETKITADIFSDLVRQRLRHYTLDHWTVCLIDSASSRVTVSPGERQVRIFKSAYFSEKDVERLFVHEIDAHVLRGENGACQPYYQALSIGLYNYTETEEGLALLNEDITGRLDKATLRNMALRVLAVVYSQERSFYETYREISKFIESTKAYNLTLRVKRGLGDTSQPGGFSKDYIYLSGWRKLKRYREEGGDVKHLYVGKIGLQDLPSILALVSSGLIKPPTYVPEYYKR